MANYLNSVTLVSENAEVARKIWARLRFALLPGGVIALGSDHNRPARRLASACYWKPKIRGKNVS